MQIVVSSAFFIFHERPSAIQILPSAGFSTTATQIIVRVSGFFSLFRGCIAPSSSVPDSYLPIGADPNVTCLTNASVIPPPLPELYCLFGQFRVKALISSPASSSDPSSKASELYCAAPQLPADRNRDDSVGTAVEVKIGMSPYNAEFSHPLRSVGLDLRINRSLVSRLTKNFTDFCMLLSS
jgi:hypothetical protein